MLLSVVNKPTAKQHSELNTIRFPDPFISTVINVVGMVWWGGGGGEVAGD